MKPKTAILSVICLLFITSCVAKRSQFTTATSTLGMTTEEFVAKFGQPLTRSVFINDAGERCEELVYSEEIFDNELMRIRSLFLFVDGKLVSQHQEEDIHYKMKKEREEMREFIREEIGKGREKKQ